MCMCNCNKMKSGSPCKCCCAKDSKKECAPKQESHQGHSKQSGHAARNEGEHNKSHGNKHKTSHE